MLDLEAKCGISFIDAQIGCHVRWIWKRNAEFSPLMLRLAETRRAAQAEQRQRAFPTGVRARLLEEL